VIINGTTVLGKMPGAGPAGEPERGEGAPRVQASFWCAAGHETRVPFAADAEVPATWECTRCGESAGPDKQNPPARRRTSPAKTHLQYLHERRTADDGERILTEALARLHGTAPPPAALPGTARRSAETPRTQRPARRNPAGATAAATRPAADGKASRPHPDSLRAAAPPRAAAGHPSRQSGAAPAGQPGEERCRTCTYRVDSPGHEVMCLGKGTPSAAGVGSLVGGSRRG
jgi:hypothetical protein